MVTRTREVFFDRRYFYKDLSHGGNLGPFAVGAYEKVGEDFVEMDDTSWDWKGRIANGLNATTNLRAVKVLIENEPANASYGTVSLSDPSDYYSYLVYGNFLGSVILIPSDVSLAQSHLADADNRARVSFYSKLASVESQFKGMVFGGELAESLRMIRRPAQSLRRGISDYLDRLKKVGPRKALKDRKKFVRDTWLEYSFGWKPLISDIDEGVGALLSSRWIRPIFKMVRAFGKSGTQPIRSQLVDLPAGGGNLRIQYYGELTHRAEVKYYGIYHSSGSGPSTFRHYGFSPWEFVPTLWELVPYSFLVDYFTNIGDLVSSWSYRNIGVEWSSKGEFLSQRSEIRRANVLTTNPAQYKISHDTGSLGSSAVELIYKWRAAQAGVPLPSFRFECPGFGSTKWLNLLALTTQIDSTRRKLAS